MVEIEAKEDKMQSALAVSLEDQISTNEVIEIYKANEWSSAGKPTELMAALRNSHFLVTGRMDGKLVGLGNAISDGHLVVYFPHLLVHPKFQRRGIGRALMNALLKKYEGIHQMMLTADGRAIEFYKSLGFSRAGKTQPMWVYSGSDH